MKKALNRPVLQTANLSKVVKRRRGRRKKGTSNEEGNGEKKKRRGGWGVVVGGRGISEKESTLTERWRERRAQIGK